jgi:hypothetical protein
MEGLSRGRNSPLGSLQEGGRHFSDLTIVPAAAAAGKTKKRKLLDQWTSLCANITPQSN